MNELLEASIEVARLAGAAALKHYRRGIVVERKGDGSPVTRADREAEQVARDWIAKRFPNDAVLGEELGEKPGTSGRRWLLDPVDGTRTFVRGVPLWGSLVAVIESDTVLAGAAVYPAVGESVVAAPGEGCWHDGVRCRVSTVASMAEATVMTTDIRTFAPGQQQGWNRLVAAADMVRAWGDCYGYLLVATGRVEVMVDAQLMPWDGPCFVPIIAEAGGRLTDLEGRQPSQPRSAIATNGALADEARRLFGIGA